MKISGGMGYALRLALASVLLAAVAILASVVQPDVQYVPIWPATALGLALIWRHGERYAPAIFIANFGNAVFSGVPSLALATGFASLETLFALLALVLLRHFYVRSDLANLRELGMFTLAAAVASAPAALVFPTVVVTVFGHPVPQSVLQGAYYWMSAFFSLLIFTPVLMAAHHLPALGPRRLLRLGALLGVTVIVAVVIVLIARQTSHQLLFLLLPLVVMCSVVAGVGGASAAALIGVTAMMLSENFADPSPIATHVRLLFAATMIITGYLLGAMWADRARIGRELEHRARHDALTGLLNRFEFERRLDVELRGEPEQHALLYLDLDQFKLLNDTCGHMAGDDVLRELGRALQTQLPPAALLARLGGDEFGCLIRRCSEEAAVETARGLLAVIRDFRYATGDLQFSLGVSIGVTWFAGSNGDTVDSVLGRADVACYAAKEEGRNRIHVYHPRDEKMLRRHWEIREASQLQAALDAGRFELHAQRICDIAPDGDDTPFYEVLLRLRGDSGFASASEFLPVAHRYGMISLIDRWVLERTAEYLSAHARESLVLSVNISGATLDTPGFVQLIASLPLRYGFAPRQLCLEVTESVAINRLTRAVEGMQRLREQGFRIALDDFGSGVASFGYLRELPVSLVKLDGRFVRDLGHDPAAELVIEALVRVAALRGIRCIAEWVEEDSVLQRLRVLGVHYAQGYLLHRPAPLEGLRVETAVRG